MGSRAEFPLNGPRPPSQGPHEQYGSSQSASSYPTGRAAPRPTPRVIDNPLPPRVFC